MSELAQELPARVQAHMCEQGGVVVPGVNGEALRAYVERLERLDEEIAALNEDKKEVYAEAKGNGFDPKILKAVIKYRREDRDKRAEMETLLDLYLRAIGD